MYGWGKVIGINLMHLDLKVNDGIYAFLLSIDVKSKITKLGDNKRNKDIMKLIEEMLGEMRN
jgi:hypothetical protein